jgi:tetratricopeptide (TPR) repeat protein
MMSVIILFKIDIQPLACFNIGTMLIDKGEFINGVNYIEKIYKKKDFKKFLELKGLNCFFDDPAIKEATATYFNCKFNNTILKLKNIYQEYEKNLYINFLLAFSYLALKKYDKASCFFTKIFKLNEIYKLDNKIFYRKLVSKSSLVNDKIASLLPNTNDSYIQDLISLEDFAVICDIEEYEDEYEESINDKMNNELNIFLSALQTKRKSSCVIRSYNEMIGANKIKI